MKISRILFIAAISAILFSSCASQRTFTKLHPVNQDVIWVDGKEVVKDEKDGLKVVASHDGFWNEFMVFDVEVFNQSEQPIIVSPRNFTYTPLNENRDSLRSIDSRYTLEYQAIEPHERIEVIQEEMRQANVKVRRARIFNTALFIGGFIAILATGGSHSEGAWQAVSLGETAIQVAQVKRIIDHENYYSKMDKLNGEQNVLAYEQFNTVTLQPQTSIRGAVFLEKNLRAKYVVLKYKTPTDNIHFTFEQVNDITH
jgi:hypothetical protein